MQVYDVGEPRRIDSSWYDSNGDAMEPSAITLTVTHPNGTVDTFSKVPDLSQGATTADWFRWVTPDADGVWRFNFVGVVDGYDVEQGGMFLVGAGATTSPNGPCEPWVTWDEVEDCGPVSIQALSPEQREQTIDLASEILFNLTDRSYPGICERTRSLCFACGRCYPTRCGCVPYNGIDLGKSAPVWGAWDVIVDGITLAPSEYTVIGRRYLALTNGHGWPTGWDLLDPNAFRATWAVGRPIPAGARKAAQLFAIEIAKLCAADKTCQLPQRVTNITREGVSYTILDSLKMIDDGKTGLPLVDLWIVSDKKARSGRARLMHPSGESVRQRP